MDPEVSIAELSIVDGAWQESPDNVSILDEAGRGTLFVLAEITGEADGRDALARELVETARREYAASRGSITFGLAQAVGEANSFFYNANLNTPREARRIGGITAAVLRAGELFIAQGGPGLTCLARGAQLQRFPADSPWFDASEEIGDFNTLGAVPLGLRREYNPDLFHLTLQPGDTILLATRSLAHLLTERELLDTLAHRHPDEIIESLEDVAGAADLSAIAIHLAGDPVAPVAIPAPVLEPAPEPVSPQIPDVRLPPPATEPEYEMASGPERMEEQPAWPPLDQALEMERARSEAEGEIRRAQTEAEGDRRRLGAEQARAQRTRVLGSIGSGLEKTLAASAGAISRIDWGRIAAGSRRVLSAILRTLVEILILAVRAFLPGKPDDAEFSPPATASRNVQLFWRIAALVFPVLLILLGAAAWFTFRQDTQRVQAAQVSQWLEQADTALKAGVNLAKTDKGAARDAFQRAMTLAQQAQKQSPSNAAARNVFYQAQDALDGVNGISVLLFQARFATFSDGRANPTRIVSHVPDIFILDRGTQRIYRYSMNEAGSSAAPVAGDGVILKMGDRIGERTVGEIIDMLWIDAGRLVAFDRNGIFLLYDPVKSTWLARAAVDGSQWAKASLASSYVGNLYLLDPSKNQIWKYVASAEGIWSSAVSYLQPGVNVDLSGAVDLAIDGDVWVLRGDGSLWRFNAGKLADFTPRDLETPVTKAVSLFTSQTLVGLYIADASNQRIIQFDKVTGKFIRQIKPRGEVRDSFSTLKSMAVDETSRKLFFINGNQAYLANIPQ